MSMKKRRWDLTDTGWLMVLIATLAGIAIFSALFVGKADAEDVRWRDQIVCDSAGVCEVQPWWDVAEVTWPGSGELFRVAECNSYPCVRSVVTGDDIPPAVDVLVRTRSDNGWSGYSNPQQYWECKDVGGADGIVGIPDFLAAFRLGGIQGFAAFRRFFGDTC
jgi:hypothetical protein